MIYIYTLSDPLTNEIRYVGKTKNCYQRFRHHLVRSANPLSHKRNWIEQLRRQGLKPIMEIIDIVEDDGWQFWETYWIQQLKVWNFRLVNITNGGDGLHNGNNTSYSSGHIPWNKNKIGHKTSKRKPVLQLDLEGNFIREFQSCFEASLQFNCGEENIRNVCRGKTKTAKNFKWKFKHE